MSQYTLSSREIPLNASYDVIVIGGGPAGCAAATASARDGAKTLLIEATGSLGGMGTLGLVPAWCPFSDKEIIIYQGIAQEVFEKTKAGMPHVDKDKLDWVPIDPERLKSVYDELVVESGADVLFNTTLSAVDAADGIVNAVIVTNKSGLNAFTSKVYIDCTGDADLCAWAGAEFQKGDPETGDLQPATHCFVIANVDMYAYRHGPQFNRHGTNIPQQMAADDKYPLILDSHCCNNIIGPGCVGFNSGHIYNIDNTDPVSLSHAYVQGRKIASQYRDALAEYMPQVYGNGFLVSTGSLMGIRETRRIIGDYLFTLEDYVARQSFPDEICRNSYCLDVHLTLAEHQTFDAAGRTDIEEQALYYDSGESHGIPYRCLTPKDLTNVLVAGRSISTDRRSQGSTRVMPVCLAMGEAAGIAGSMAVELDQDVHAVDTEILRDKIRAVGGYLP